MSNSPNPTKRTYEDLNYAYDFFNQKLFGGKLPRCLIKMQRRNRSYRYFVGDHFATVDDEEITDEIALKPSKRGFPRWSMKWCISRSIISASLSRSRYHNTEWATMMKALGLIPSDTGVPGGRGCVATAFGRSDSFGPV